MASLILIIPVLVITMVVLFACKNSSGFSQVEEPNFYKFNQED